MSSSRSRFRPIPQLIVTEELLDHLRNLEKDPKGPRHSGTAQSIKNAEKQKKIIDKVQEVLSDWKDSLSRPRSTKRGGKKNKKRKTQKKRKTRKVRRST
jgi:hypothetical protein